MIILSVLMVILVIGVVILVYFNDSETCEMTGFALTIVGSVCFLVAMIMFPVIRWNVNSEIQQFKSVELSITQARTKLDIESAAIYVEIIDANKWLADKKYWNGTLFDIWILDEVKKLEPLK